jgi:autotransporter-associated beta strand protein
MKLRLLLASLSVASVLGAAEFPAVDNGVITLDVASGSTTYDAALPSATKLVKTGAGEAILTAATTAFAGSVDVQAGTLTIQDGAALGANTPISVTGDAATFHLNIPRPADAGQTNCFFSGHNLTICGQGVNGKGAFRYTALEKNGNDDNMLDSLTLSGDATMDVKSRFGIQKALNLNGHTLTRIGDKQFIWLNNSATINAGAISNVTGKLTSQRAPKFTDPANTTIYVAGGALDFWYSKTAIPCRVVMCGGGFSGSGNTAADNILSGPVDFTKDISTGMTAGHRLELTGTTTVATSVTNLDWNTASSLYLNGPVSFARTATQLRILDGGRLVCSSNVTRRVGQLRTSEKARVDLKAGTLECRDVLRISNARAARTGMFQSGGDFSAVGSSYIGESTNSYGVYQMAGGTATFSNIVNVGYWPTSEGLIVQTGGTMRLVRTNSWACVRTPASRGLIAVLDNATNDTRAARYGSSNRLRLGWAYDKEQPYGGGRGTLAVCGAHAVATTEALMMGMGSYATTNLVVVADGGTLKARRFYCAEGQHAEARNDVYVDGGIVMPTFWSGWNHVFASATNFYARSPNLWAIGPKGLVIDTSELEGSQEGDDVSTYKNGSYWPHSLSDASGQGIASITLPTNAGFTALTNRGPVFVDIEGPGHGASAFAAFNPDTCKLTDVRILSAGSGYDETTRVYVRHPDATGRTECAYTLTGARSGGSVTKRGANWLVLHGTNTYTGGTVVEGGTLRMGTATAFPSNTPLAVKTGGAFDAGGFDLVVSWLGGTGGAISNMKGNAMTVNQGLDLTAADILADGTEPLTVTGKVTFAEGATIRIKDPESLVGRSDRAQVVFLTATDGFDGAVPHLELDAKDGKTWRVFAHGKKFCLAPQKGLMLIIR